LIEVNAPLEQPIPVTLLTGFLGAGKTTLVRRLLEEAHGQRVAVLVNEFGTLGIDTDRIGVTRGPVIEMLNGCICCASEGDLLRGIETLLSDQSRIDAILVETSGLADPWPVIAALETVKLNENVELSAVVSLVDAENFDDNLDHAEAAFQQLTAADLLLINKADLVSSKVVDLIADRLRLLNSTATILPAVQAELPPGAIGSVRHETVEAPAGEHRHHHQGENFVSVDLAADRPLDPERFDDWLTALPRTVVRMKGTISLAGTAGALLFDRVGRRVTVSQATSPTLPAGSSQIIAIGHALDPADLRIGFEECRT
jgi:G3E family GTPase